MALSEIAETTPSRRARLRDGLEQSILLAAEQVFASQGFEGASVGKIAEAAGLSKQNLMYYFPTKLALYQRVLDDVLDDWLGSMDALAHSALSPEQALRAYIRAKLEFSKTRPTGSRLFALEVVSGAKHYGGQIRSRVVPLLREDIQTLNRWIADGHAPISAEHFMFIVWAATQSYADFAVQMRLVLGEGCMTEDFFNAAENTLYHMALAALHGGAG